MSELLTAWEWEGGWTLVRPLTASALGKLHSRLAPEAGYVNFIDEDTSYILGFDRDEFQFYLFLLDPSSRISLLVTVDGTANIVPREFSISTGMYDLEPRADSVLSTEMLQQRWWEAVRRIYGMVDAVGVLGFTANEDEYPLAPLGDDVFLTYLLGPYLALGGAKNRRGLNSRKSDRLIVDELRPWLVHGSPAGDGELMMLLGEAPSAFSRRMTELGGGA